MYEQTHCENLQNIDWNKNEWRSGSKNNKNRKKFPAYLFFWKTLFRGK